MINTSSNLLIDQTRIKLLVDSNAFLELFLNRTGYIEDTEKFFQSVTRNKWVKLFTTDFCLDKVRLYTGRKDSHLGDDTVSLIRQITDNRIIGISPYLEEARNMLPQVRNFDAALETVCAIRNGISVIIAHNVNDYTNVDLDDELSILGMEDLAKFDRLVEVHRLRAVLELQCQQPPITTQFIEPYNLLERSINTGLWTKSKVDEVAQEMQWRLLPPLNAGSFRCINDNDFEVMTRALQRDGLLVPNRASTAYLDLELKNTATRLFAAAWEYQQSQSLEWFLLLVLKAQPGKHLPQTTRLIVNDADQLLAEQSMPEEAIDAWIYVQVSGTWNERFWVTIDINDNTGITLPPFTFNPQQEI